MISGEQDETNKNRPLDFAGKRTHLLCLPTPVLSGGLSFFGP